MTVEPVPLPSAGTDARVRRRLTTVLYADAVGYTQLMGNEEDWTLDALAAARDCFASVTSARNGRVVAMPGDAVLAEFGTVTDAVICAIDAQRKFSRSPLVSPAGKLLQFRIGLHSAQVVSDGADILGDGVNTAARIMEVAEPGGICISARVYEEVRDRLDLLCSDLGEVMLRSAERQSRLYRIDVAAEENGRPEVPEIRSGSVQLVPYRASVAVLPFSNLAASNDDDHIVDGLTDTLINALASSRWFYVIARSSSFRFRNSGLNLREIGRALGTRYIVQGSFQRLGRNVRVTTHLVEAATGGLLHSDRFEGSFADAFSMQDTIALQIAATVEPGVILTRAAEKARHASNDISALDHVFRAYSKLWELTPAGLKEAMPHLREAIARDGSLSQAHAGIAVGAILEVYMGWAEDPARTLEIGRQAALHAIELDHVDAWAHVALGIVYMQTDQLEKAIGMMRTALKLNPSFALAYGFLAHAMNFAGRFSEAQTLLRLALRLSPQDMLLTYWLDGMAMAHLQAKRYDDAIYWARRSTEEHPYWPGGLRVLAIAYGHLGRQDEAREALAQMLQLQPNVSLEYLRRIWPYRDAAHFEANLKGLQAAGWTEGGRA